MITDYYGNDDYDYYADNDHDDHDNDHNNDDYDDHYLGHEHNNQFSDWELLVADSSHHAGETARQTSIH